MTAKVLAGAPDIGKPSDLPAHARISTWLERLITSNRLKVGDRLPPEVDMAGALGVSRMTLRQALADVEHKGLLERRRGRVGGSFVTSPRIDFSLAALPGFTEQLQQANVVPGAAVVSVAVVRPSEQLRAALALKGRVTVHEIVRVRSADGAVITLEHTFLPTHLFPDLGDYDLSESLYGLMEAGYGLGPRRAEEVISPTRADATQAKLLQVKRNEALLLIERTSWAANGAPVEFSYLYFRPDRARITVTTEQGRTSVNRVPRG